jgi:hypothetical protein
MLVCKPTAQVPLPPAAAALGGGGPGTKQKPCVSKVVLTVCGLYKKKNGEAPSDIHGRNLGARTAQAPTAQWPCPVRESGGQPAGAPPLDWVRGGGDEGDCRKRDVGEQTSSRGALESKLRIEKAKLASSGADRRGGGDLGGNQSPILFFEEPGRGVGRQ